ncbi:MULTISPECIES: choice-of-anchor M domain-containing protein [unclassified Streptomyces]|uniref:choice-of-anchor M domain-containing protein n=1 Tax=unclassified Streptomyces TaxID=2593676 RepID=UPI0036E6625F
MAAARPATVRPDAGRPGRREGHQPGLRLPRFGQPGLAAAGHRGRGDRRRSALPRRLHRPGAYALYTYDAMSGAEVLFNSKDGVPDSFGVPANTHAHGGWAFTKEGTYRLTFRMSGKLADGTAVNDTETVAFVVGDGKADAVNPGGGSSDAGSSPSPSPSASGSAKAGAGQGTSSGSMAGTGAGDTALLAAAAAGLALVGGGAVWGVRRRRRGV